MKKCLSCNSLYPVDCSSCDQCDAEVEMLDGVPAYAPDFVRSVSEGFNEDSFEQLAKLEQRNFWFRSRNKLIIWAIKKYAPGLTNFLEIGCGTGFVVAGIGEAFPDASLNGSELFPKGLKHARKRSDRCAFMQMDARRIPFHSEFDVIGAFDVIEHISEDHVVLSEIYNSLRPGGIAIMTVPQHMWLWSKTDEYAHHVRRYAPTELQNKAISVGFNIIRSSSFMSLLLPLMAASRLVNRKKENANPHAELQINPILNKALEAILYIEKLWILLGFNIPAGGSRLVVAQKPN